MALAVCVFDEIPSLVPGGEQITGWATIPRGLNFGYGGMRGEKGYIFVMHGDGGVDAQSAVLDSTTPRKESDHAQ